MKLNIDLGEKMGGPMESMKMNAEQKHYPTFIVTKDEPIGLPDSGKMVVEFKKIAERTSKNGESKQYECTIEVHKLVSVDKKKSENEDAPTKNYDEAGDALDKLAREKSKENEDDEGGY